MKQIKIYFLIFLAFIAVVPFGTLSHEMGHIAMAQFFGFETTLHFGSMFYDGDSNSNLNAGFIDFLINFSGPTITILISLIGLWFISREKVQKIKKNRLPIRTLFFLLLSLFISRELFISINILFGHENSALNSDEYIIANYLQLNVFIFSSIIALLAFCLCLYAVLRCVGKRFLPYFLIIGLLGSVLGFLFWMKLIGPLLLP